MNIVLQSNGYASSGLVLRFEAAARRCGQLVVALGLAVLLGWATGLGTLTSIVASWVPMPVNAAVCLALAGVSVIAAGRSRADRCWHAVQLVSAFIVLGVGLATLLQYSLGLQFGIDQLLYAAAGSDPRPFPGRMAISAATNFLLTGMALAILDTRARPLAQLLALLSMIVSTAAILGYAYGVSQHSGFFSTIAVHTAVGTLLVGVGILLVRPAHGVTAVLVSDTVGGVLARRLLPFAVATPLVVGWLRIEGERRAFYDSSLGVAMASVAYVILFALFTWRDAEALRRSDAQRLDAERVKQVNQAQMNGLIESAMDAIVMLDDGNRIIVFNPAAEKMFGYARADILGGSLDQLLPQRFRNAHQAQMHAFGSSGTTSRRMGTLGSVAAIRADGTEFPAEASISHFDLGASKCYLAIVRDTTDRMRIERELHASERRERERSQELSNLLFAVPAAVCIAHDRLLADVRGNELYDRWFGGDDAGLPRQPGAAKDAGSLADWYGESGEVYCQ